MTTTPVAPLRRWQIGSLLPTVAFFLFASPLMAQTGTDKVVRVLQTSSAGTDVYVIDPATNKVVDVIGGIAQPHGGAPHPDGTKYYFTSEIDHTVDVFDTSTLERIKQIPLSGSPDNIVVSTHSRNIYVGISTAPIIDVIDTDTDVLVKSIEVAGEVHTPAVSPDGRWVVAGSSRRGTITAIDTETDEAVWSMQMDAGVRPLVFEGNPDGSPKRLLLNIAGFHGFYVLDWATRKVVDKISPPMPSLAIQNGDGIQGAPSHGLAISPDMTQVWCSSRVTKQVYAWSLPNFEYLGAVATGSPEWLTITPDSRYLYIGAAGENRTIVVDTKAMEVVARIPVGQVPKRVFVAEIPAVKQGARR